MGIEPTNKGFADLFVNEIMYLIAKGLATALTRLRTILGPFSAIGENPSSVQTVFRLLTASVSTSGCPDSAPVLLLNDLAISRSDPIPRDSDLFGRSDTRLGEPVVQLQLADVHVSPVRRFHDRSENRLEFIDVEPSAANPFYLPDELSHH